MRVAIRWYPPDFQAVMGRDMLEAFERELRRRRRRAEELGGWVARAEVFRFASTTLAATIWLGIRERLYEARGGAPDQRRSGETRIEGGDRMRRDEVIQNLRLFVRQSRRRPGFTIMAATTLAVGIGAAAAVFSVVQGVLLRSLPYPDSDRLVYLTSGGAASLPNLRDLAERLESLEALEGIFVPNTVTLTEAGDPAQIQRSWVSGRFFDVVGLQPSVGRLLGPEDVGTSRAVLSHGFWQTRFGADPAVIGRSLLLNETPHEVVGVAAPAMGTPFAVEIWASLPWGPGEGPRGARGWRAVEPYARLAEGWTLEAARAELTTEWRRLQGQYPDENEGWRVGIETVKAQVTGDDSTSLRLLFGATALFLLIACANVASLFLSRLDERRREFAVRHSLGAARGRLLRQAWTEGLGLALLGGVLGVAMAATGVEWGMARFGGSLSRGGEVTLDGGVLLFALLATGLTAGVVASVTLLAWGTEEPARALARVGRSVAGRSGLLRRGMVVTQVAMALMMVTGLGLLIRSFQKMQAVDPGVRTESVIVASLGRFSGSRYPDAATRRALLDRIQGRIAAVPGVEGVALASHQPLGGCCSNQAFHSVEEPDADIGTEVRSVSPNYFEVLGIPLLDGEGLATLDSDGPRSVVVSEVMTQELFGSARPIGREVISSNLEAPVRIHGVVGAVREYAPTRPAPAVLYFSTRQVPMAGGYLVVRSGLAMDRLVPALRDALAEVDPTIPLDGARPLDEVLATHMAGHRATTVLMTLLGGLALGLGLIGIYGVMSHAVLGRQREIGVRLALGASPESVATGIFQGALRLVLPGLLLGLAGTYAARRMVESLLYEVSSLDPLVYGAVTVLFLAAALLATVVPARRAARVDVLEVLSES